MLVQDWMTRTPVTVEADTPFLEARLILRDRRIRHLPVLDHGKLVGVVTDRDLKEAAPSGASSLDVYEMNYLLLKMRVRELVRREAVTVKATDSVERAALLMHDHRIGCLPVVDDAGALVGLITEADLLAAMVEMLGYREQGTRIAFAAADGAQAHEDLTRLLRELRLDLRSLVTYASHARPGYRDVVVRVRGEQADALVTALRERYGASVSVLVA